MESSTETLVTSEAYKTSEPTISGGGSLLVAWQLKNKRVLIVGGGEVASSRIESILVTDAQITLLSPAKGLCARTKELIAQYPDRITHYDRKFTGPPELQKVDMVLTAIDNVHKSREIVDLCREARIPVNAADIPDSCDFYFGAQIRDGPLQIMISTNGNGPKVASLIKQKLQRALTGNEGEAVRKTGRLREMLKGRAPGVGGPVGRRRMKWMSSVCTEWDMESFAQLDEETMVKLLDLGWETNRVPSTGEIFGLQPSTSLFPSFSQRTVRPSASDSTEIPKNTFAPVQSSSSDFILPLAIGFSVGVLSTLLGSVIRRR